MSLHIAGPIAETEHERIARAFIAAFSTGNTALVETFLHPNVVYQSDAASHVRGRDNTIGVYQRLFQRFTSIRMEVVTLAVSGHVVLAELSLSISMPGRRVLRFLSFVSLEIDDGEVAVWRQVHA